MIRLTEAQIHTGAGQRRREEALARTEEQVALLLPTQEEILQRRDRLEGMRREFESGGGGGVVGWAVWPPTPALFSASRAAARWKGSLPPEGPDAGIARYMRPLPARPLQECPPPPHTRPALPPPAPDR